MNEANEENEIKKKQASRAPTLIGGDKKRQRLNKRFVKAVAKELANAAKTVTFDDSTTEAENKPETNADGNRNNPALTRKK